jgi:hypothetical protein
MQCTHRLRPPSCRLGFKFSISCTPKQIRSAFSPSSLTKPMSLRAGLASAMFQVTTDTVMLFLLSASACCLCRASARPLGSGRAAVSSAATAVGDSPAAIGAAASAGCGGTARTAPAEACGADAEINTANLLASASSSRRIHPLRCCMICNSCTLGASAAAMHYGSVSQTATAAHASCCLQCGCVAVRALCNATWRHVRGFLILVLAVDLITLLSIKGMRANNFTLSFLRLH